LSKAMTGIHAQVAEKATRDRKAAIQKHKNKTHVRSPNFQVGVYVLVTEHRKSATFELQLRLRACFLPTARFTAGLPALGAAISALLTAVVIRDRTFASSRPKSTPFIRYQARTAERASCLGRIALRVVASHSRMTRKAAAFPSSAEHSAAICIGSNQS
jgi:hypothetical protein